MSWQDSVITQEIKSSAVSFIYKDISKGSFSSFLAPFFKITIMSSSPPILLAATDQNFID